MNTIVNNISKPKIPDYAPGQIYSSQTLQDGVDREYYMITMITKETNNIRFELVGLKDGNRAILPDMYGLTYVPAKTITLS